MLRRLGTAIGLAVLAGHVSAQGAPSYPDLEFVCNADGAKVTEASGRVFYLGKSCDAFAPGRGTGRWWYSASGFAVGFGDGTTLYRIDLPCDALPYCQPPEYPPQ